MAMIILTKRETKSGGYFDMFWRVFHPVALVIWLSVCIVLGRGCWDPCQFVKRSEIAGTGMRPFKPMLMCMLARNSTGVIRLYRVCDILMQVK